MAERDPDQLFQRFARNRDVRAVGELFDLAAPQLARVAWHLVHDANEVEDLVQATFLTALDGASTFDPARHVMPWLLGILANHARNARRSAGRRPESLASEPAHAHTPDAALEQRELRDAVDRALADLPELYRSVVASWLLDGEQPTEIARREGKPASTVRVQLRRGLEMLRNTLPAGAAALAASSTLSPRSLARARGQVIAHASQVGASSAAIAVGGLIVGKWLLGAAAVLALAAGVGWLASRPASAPTAPAVASLAGGESLVVAAEVGEPPPANARSEVELPGSASASEEAAPPRPGWWLIGHVAADVGTDVARVSADIDDPVEERTANSVGASSNHHAGFDQQVAGADFEVDVSELVRDREHAPKSFVARYDHPRFLPTFTRVDVAGQVELATAFANERVELHAEFAPSPAELVVVGRAVAPQLVDPEDIVAVLAVFDEHGKLEREPAEHVHCRSDGTFRVRSSRATGHALAVVAPGHRPETREVAADAHGEVDVGEVSFERGEHIAGSVRVHGSQRWDVPSVQASLRIVETLNGFSDGRPGADRTANPMFLGWRDRHFTYSQATGRVDEHGAFRIDGLEATSYRVNAPTFFENSTETIASTCLCSDEALDGVMASRDDVDFELNRTSLRVELRGEGRSIENFALQTKFGDGRWSRMSALGSVCVVSWNGDVPPTLRIECDGFAPAEFTAPQTDGGVRVVDLKRSDQTVELILEPIFECSRDVGSFKVLLIPLGDPTVMHRCDRDVNFSTSEPEWRFHEITPGRYQIFVSSATGELGSECIAPNETHDLAAGTVRVPLVFARGGQFAFELHGASDGLEQLAVLDADGNEVIVYVAYFNSQTGHETRFASQQLSVPSGVRVATFHALAPGNYTLRVAPHGKRAQIERPLRIAGGETTELAIDLDDPNAR